MQETKLVALTLCCLMITVSLFLFLPLGMVSDDEETTNLSLDEFGGKMVFTGGGTTEIYDLSDLDNIRSDLNADYILMNDIDASGSASWDGGNGFTPIGDESNPFNGTLNGNGYNITGLFINRTAYSVLFQALFHTISGNAIIRDLTLTSVSIAGNNFTSSLVSKNNGLIINTTVSGNISGVYGVAGLVSHNIGEIRDCHGSINVTGVERVGGLVSFNQNNAVVVNSSVQGQVTGTTEDAGGLVGFNSGLVQNCSAVTTINGNFRVGGLVGSNYGHVRDSSTSGSVHSSSNGAGGLIGYQSSYTVINCSSSSTVSGGSSIGGLVGAMGTATRINLSYSTGDVHGTNSVGGLVGSASGSATISNCYSNGNVTATTQAGGLVGGQSTVQIYNSYTISSVNGTNANGLAHGYGYAVNSFWNTDIYATSAIGIGKTSAELKQANTFIDAGWAIGSVWSIIDGVTYPSLTGLTLAANAGPDQSVDDGSTVDFDGSSSIGENIDNYTWSFTYNGSTIILYGASPNHVFTIPGIYFVTLIVRDTTNNTAQDNMTVTVHDIIPPVADAGTDILLVGGGTVTFNGSGSTDSAGITNYTWMFMYNGSLVNLYGVSPTFDFQIPGVYVITLTVKDAANNIASDTFAVTVSDGGSGGSGEQSPENSWYIWLILIAFITIIVLAYHRFRRQN